MGIKTSFKQLMGAAALFLAAGRSYAIDPRFELDPKVLDRKVEQPVQPESRPKPSTATVKGGKATGKQASTPSRGARKGEATVRTGSRPPHQARTHAKSGEPSQQLRMISMAPSSEGSALEAVRQFWPQMVPEKGGQGQNVAISGENYALSVDTSRYPTLPAADGGKIILDVGETIPPLVKSLLLSQGDKVRIVNDSPANRHSFFSTLLTAARFYSVEENFAVTFGTDPKLTLKADYKIEKGPDSLLNRDVLLLNVQDGKRAMPVALLSFLNQQGFRVVEPFAVAVSRESNRGKLFLITATEPAAIADSLMQALALSVDRDKSVELYDYRELGLSLTVKADRYFERGGERFVVSSFTGDPVSYTLTRLLETKGYNVIMLEGKDDFSRISDKLLSRLRLQGYYARHNLLEGGESPYSVQLSGVALQREKGQELFLTNREIDPLIRDLLGGNGYQVIGN